MTKVEYNYDDEPRIFQADKASTGKSITQISKSGNQKTWLSSDIEQMVLYLYTLGSRHQAISSHVEKTYDIKISDLMIDAITDSMIPELNKWKRRELESHYALVWMDTIQYNDKNMGNYGINTVFGLRLDGIREVLGIYISDFEDDSIWNIILEDIRNRGVRDILIVNVDNLCAISQAITSIYHDTEVLLSINHQIRNSMRYVATINRKDFMEDLKLVYMAESKEAAEILLDDLEEKWRELYSVVIKSWRNKWDNLSVFYKYPEAVRNVLCTINAINSLHRQVHKRTNIKMSILNKNGLVKALFAGTKFMEKKWEKPIQNWNLILSQLVMYFDGRLDDVLDV